MAEIATTPWNGFNVVSTFSGCGGSCLGYRMAGFRVLWANEFIPAAQDTYKANHPDSILDTRDIRTVKPEEVLRAINLKPGELDLFDGSPPCASFSTAGKREAGWGKVKAYSDTKQRTDDLFFEYARILKGLQPKVFVAENVSGLVKGTAKGYFKEILATLKDCGYRVEAKLLDAQWLGVPQMRQRIIFIGVRNDFGAKPAFPKPLPYRYSVRDAIGIGLRTKSYAANDWIEGSKPAAAIQATGQYFIDQDWEIVTAGNERHTLAGRRPSHPIDISAAATITATESSFNLITKDRKEKRKFSIAELRRICAFPDDFIFTGTYAQQWERMGRSVPPVMMQAIAATVREEILCRL